MLHDTDGVKGCRRVGADRTGFDHGLRAMTQRTERIDELLRQEITGLLARDVADPRIGFATVTDVETAPDLRHARVWVSVIGQPADRIATVRALEHAMPFVRRELGRRLRLRRIPEFSVRLDESIERGSRVMQLINKLEAGAMPEELPEGESLPTPTARLTHEGDAPEPTDDEGGPASTAQNRPPTAAPVGRERIRTRGAAPDRPATPARRRANGATTRRRTDRPNAGR